MAFHEGEKGSHCTQLELQNKGLNFVRRVMQSCGGEFMQIVSIILGVFRKKLLTNACKTDWRKMGVKKIRNRAVGTAYDGWHLGNGSGGKTVGQGVLLEARAAI